MSVSEMEATFRREGDELRAARVILQRMYALLANYHELKVRYGPEPRLCRGMLQLLQEYEDPSPELTKAAEKYYWRAEHEASQGWAHAVVEKHFPEARAILESPMYYESTFTETTPADRRAADVALCEAMKLENHYNGFRRSVMDQLASMMKRLPSHLPNWRPTLEEYDHLSDLLDAAEALVPKK